MTILCSICEKKNPKELHTCDRCKTPEICTDCIEIDQLIIYSDYMTWWCKNCKTKEQKGKEEYEKSQELLRAYKEGKIEIKE